MFISDGKSDGPAELPKSARIQTFVDDWIKQSLGVIGTQFIYEFYSRLVFSTFYGPQISIFLVMVSCTDIIVHYAVLIFQQRHIKKLFDFT